jgi:GNAT superfamily N-acetyltransferase
MRRRQPWPNSFVQLCLVMQRPAGASSSRLSGGIADQHGFPWDFPSVEAGTQLASTFIAAPSIYGIVADLDGRVVGSVFMAEGDPIRGIGTITVDPAVQGSGVGRRLMEGALESAGDAMGVRLV